MSSPLLIRRAQIDDVAAIVRLVNDGGPDGAPRATLPDPLPADYYDAFRTISADPAHELMVAEWEGTVVGTFHLTFLHYLAARNRPDLQIEAVHVARAHRGKGIGAEMMHWAIRRAREANCRRLQLTTDKLRRDAHRFYARLGFVATHEGMKFPLG